jgi:hypothetical protein
MPEVGFEPTISVFERALDRAPTAIGNHPITDAIKSQYRERR